MFSIQQRRERLNRQINERLRTLIAAYKVLGGSFTGDLTVDPTHLRDLKQSAPSDSDADQTGADAPDPMKPAAGGSDRRRRIRDAVEAALADIILLGTDPQVRLAECVARDLVAGRPVHTHELVVSLRNFIREALDIDPIPSDLEIPVQGPARPSGSGGRGSEAGHSGGAGKGGGSSGEGAGGLAGGGFGGGATTGVSFGTGDEHSPADDHGHAG